MDVFVHNPPQINNQEFICSNDHQNHAIFAKIGFGSKQKPQNLSLLKVVIDAKRTPRLLTNDDGQTYGNQKQNQTSFETSI